jgi:hypothetical protein
MSNSPSKITRHPRPLCDWIIFSLLAVWVIIEVIVGLIMFGAQAFTPAMLLITLLVAACNAAILVAAFLLRSASAALLGSMLLVAAGLLAAGLFESDSLLIGFGLTGLLITGAGALLARPAALEHAPPAAQSTTDHLLQLIHEHSMLSDSAKRVLFRERELDLLRHAIETDIQQGDYNAGLTLCDDLMNLFGRRQEAETYRSRIMQARRVQYESQVQAALAHFDGILHSHDWAAAHQEAARLKRLFPDAPPVQDIDRRILHARDAHKSELERQFLEAAEREDVPHAMDLLRQLDRYMSREEAARLSRTAQHIVAQHREHLSTQFKMAVSEHRWLDALAVGDAISREFPNSKMADEVRSMNDVLRSRASQSVAAEPR